MPPSTPPDSAARERIRHAVWREVNAWNYFRRIRELLQPVIAGLPNVPPGHQPSTINHQPS